METKPDSFSTLTAGQDLAVRSYGGITETVRVLQLPIKSYPKLLETIDVELGLVELYCNKPKGWAETLDLESHEAVLELADKLNSDFFSRWMARRVTRMERVRPGIVDRLLDNAGRNAVSSSPSSQPRSAPRAG